MNNTYAEAVVLAQTISTISDKHWTDSVDVLVCPPSIDLKPVNTVFEFDHQPIQIGAQNVYWGAGWRLRPRARYRFPHAQGCPLRAPSSATPSVAATSAKPTRTSTARSALCSMAACMLWHASANRCPYATRAAPRSSSAPRCVPRSRAWSPRRPASAWWHMSPSGPSARAARPRPSRRRTCAPPSAPRSPTCSASVGRR